MGQLATHQNRRGGRGLAHVYFYTKNFKDLLYKITSDLQNLFLFDDLTEGVVK